MASLRYKNVVPLFLFDHYLIRIIDLKHVFNDTSKARVTANKLHEQKFIFKIKHLLIFFLFETNTLLIPYFPFVYYYSMYVYETRRKTNMTRCAQTHLSSFPCFA